MSWILLVVHMLAGVQTPAQPDALRLLPLIVQGAWESAAKQGDRQPLLLEIRSFRLHTSMALDKEDVDSTEIAKAVGRPLRLVTEEQALHCPPISPSGCSIIDDGVLVRLDGLTMTASGFQALVTAKWTDRRSHQHSSIGEHQFRAWFAKENNVWVTKRVELIMTT